MPPGFPDSSGLGTWSGPRSGSSDRVIFLSARQTPNFSREGLFHSLARSSSHEVFSLGNASIAQGTHATNIRTGKSAPTLACHGLQAKHQLMNHTRTRRRWVTQLKCPWNRLVKLTNAVNVVIIWRENNRRVGTPCNIKKTAHREGQKLFSAENKQILSELHNTISGNWAWNLKKPGSLANSPLFCGGKTTLMVEESTGEKLAMKNLFVTEVVGGCKRRRVGGGWATLRWGEEADGDTQ